MTEMSSASDIPERRFFRYRFQVTTQDGEVVREQEFLLPLEPNTYTPERECTMKALSTFFEKVRQEPLPEAVAPKWLVLEHQPNPPLGEAIKSIWV